MKELLILENNVAVPSPYVLQIKEFQELVTRDKSKLKSKAVKELTYIYMLCDYRSPYAVYAEAVRKIEVKTDLFEPDWKPDSKLLAACDKYKELKETSAIKLLKAARESVAKLEVYFTTIDLTEVDDNNKPIYSAKDLVMNLSKMGDVVNGLTKLEDIVKKEVQTDSGNRGGVETNKYSK